MRACRTALLVWAVLLCVASGLGASPAGAHATLLASDPGDGATIAAAPAQVVLTFNEPVSALVLRLAGPDGQGRALPPPESRAERLAIPLPTPLANGTHALSWRVVSLDGHPVGGTLVFSIGAPSGTTAAVSSPNATVMRLTWAARVALYAGCVLAIGGFAFATWISRRSGGEGLVAAAASVGLAATAFSVGLQGLDALGLEVTEIATWPPWRTGLATSFGLTAGLTTAGLGATLLGLPMRSPFARRAMSLGALAAMAVAFVASGHAASAFPSWLTRPAVALHVLAVAVWIGALVPLGLALRDERGAAPLARFSLAVPWVVAALVLTGAVLATVQMRGPADLIATAYGRVLLAKLVLVVLLLLLAAWNRWRVTQPALCGDAGARRRLRQAIALEIALALAILGLVAAWRFTPHPRALVQQAEAPASLHIHTARAMADVRFAPGRAGTVTVEIDLLTGEFGPLDAREVTVSIENRAAGFEAIVRPAAKVGTSWRVAGFPIPSDGRWRVRLDVLVDDFDKETLDGEVDIPPR